MFYLYIGYIFLWIFLPVLPFLIKISGTHMQQLINHLSVSLPDLTYSYVSPLQLVSLVLSLFIFWINLSICFSLWFLCHCPICFSLFLLSASTICLSYVIKHPKTSGFFLLLGRFCPDSRMICKLSEDTLTVVHCY